MKWIKRIGLAIVAVILLVVLANIGLNWWISSRLPGVINRENDSPYQITYKDLDISLLTRQISATEIIVVPKSSLDSKQQKAGLYGKIESLEVNGFSIFEILFSNRIKARSLIVNKPELTLLKTSLRAIKNPKSITSEVVKPFSKIVYVSDVFLNNGAIKITELKLNRPILAVSNLNIKLEGIVITDETLEQKIPLSFKTYAIDCDSVFYQANEFYHLTGKKIETTQDGLKLNDFRMVPEYSRENFLKRISIEKDHYAVSATQVLVNRMQWGFRGDRFSFNANSVILTDVNANIYRNKGTKDDLKKKKLYSELLRNIPFAMKIDTLALRHSKIVYEEALQLGKKPGVLTFSKFNMWVAGLQSGYGQTKLPDVKIKILCNFMESSRLDVDWSFNVLDKSEGFNIRGRFFDFPAERLSEFTKPYLNATFGGSLDEVYFNFSGNDQGASGDFAINYDNLKVKIFKKKTPKKRNKILSALANLFVKDDTKDKVTTAEVSVQRQKNRSFFNLLWKCLEEGLKKIML